MIYKCNKILLSECLVIALKFRLLNIFNMVKIKIAKLGSMENLKISMPSWLTITILLIFLVFLSLGNHLSLLFTFLTQHFN